MKFKLKELIDMQPSLGRAMAKELPARTAFKLGRFAKKAMSELDEYEKQRVALLKKFAVLEEDGETLKTTGDGKAVFLKKEDEASFNKELDQLVETEVEINFEQMSLDDLGSVNISGSILLGIGHLFKDFTD